MNQLLQVAFKLYKLLFRLTGSVLPKNEKLVIFESFLGKQYSDNPRAIYEYMTKHYTDYTLYWSIDTKKNNIGEREELLTIKRFSLKWLFLMNRAKYWVSNSRLPLWIPKPKGTVYLQTWHGTPLKKLALDMKEVHMPGTNTGQYKKNFIKEARKWDFLISPNSYSTEIFKGAFAFNKTLLETGYPRNDILVNHNDEVYIRQLKEKMGIPLSKKIILYAPTWRDNNFYKKGKYKFDLNVDLDLLRNQLGDSYIIILRLHYLVSENLNMIDYKGFVVDFSDYEDISHLYLVSDMLITDYSSVFFDYAILKRPILFYVYDLDMYRDELRGFYFDIESNAPGPLVKDTNEILYHIREFERNCEYFNSTLENFHKKFCYLEDGKSSQRVVEKVFVL